MAKSSDYEMQTTWRVPGTAADVKEILGGPRLDSWWPAVYLDVQVIREAGPDGVGRAVALYTKGWLPYTLRWTMTVSEPITEKGFALTAEGDLNGTGRWTFEPDGPEVVITFDWRVSTAKPLLRRLNWLFRPLFAANHRWAMAAGEESLKLELRRRRAAGKADRTTVPPPPGPTFRRGRA